jgi:hypothetical protein
MTNLVKVEAHRARKEALRIQMEQELIEQADPRMLGNGEVFDNYKYADKNGVNFYERYMKGEDVNHGWVNDSDFEEAPLDQ